MQKNISFGIEEMEEVPNWAEGYKAEKFSVMKCCFLSSRENSHGIKISPEVLRKSAPSILGQFLVAKLEWGDATIHKSDEKIFGYFPQSQDVEFVEDGEILKAYAYAVISKKYGKELNHIFELDNLRNTSVEMTVEFAEDSENEAVTFDIYGLTILGKTVNGSCPDADAKMIRFSEQKAEKYFNKKSAERKEDMEEKKDAEIIDANFSVNNIDSEGKEEDANMEDETKMAETEEIKEEQTADEQMAESTPEEEVKDEQMAENPEADDAKEEEEEVNDHEELMARIAQLEADIADKDNIIMGCNAELEELRKFKAGVEENQKAVTVSNVMADIREYVDAAMYNSLKDEGMACKFSEIDAWANKAKALCFGAVKKTREKQKIDNNVWSFAAPIEAVKKYSSIWDK